MLIDFKHKTAVVTGGARGIGAEIASRLALSGAKVIVADVDAAAAQAHAHSIQAGGGTALGVRTDVTEEDSVAELMHQAKAAYGAPAILINNAGISLPSPSLEATVEAWNKVLAVNLLGAFICSKAALPAMKSAGWGRIVNVVSFAAKSSPLYADNAAYAASKAGLMGLIHNLAIEFAPYGITVTGVAPGIVETDMFRAAHSQVRHRELLAKLPIGRFTGADEVASLIAFLASDHASSITGEIININGGLYLD
ncbi:SDR family NAD(P)-dependent oxidoreductase [Paenarthrobacter sp. A20]|uniref:SDR family NAD(P)-dependent oxidoreductase n=1 Tax=Paenarthrobacter sp. A20 TaxID=2817891 RepID=UPI0020A21C83|nr:SDR family NAD(P)-dependent oxidoreductase [Paenarthrobacter sp. A20]MCP1415740.1 NAD(P)-dependent dehydrogenase (short-subunit alcohol dehydrogenase family) [Paenarthrobacter sp. A20]